VRAVGLRAAGPGMFLPGGNFGADRDSQTPCDRFRSIRSRVRETILYLYARAGWSYPTCFFRLVKINPAVETAEVSSQVKSSQVT